MSTAGLLEGVTVVEVAHLGAAALTTPLSDLGAEVIKVEAIEGDYGRQMTWPIVEGTSLLFRHLNRGKRSVCLDLAHPDGAEVFRRLVAGADVVVEGMRPGALDRRGLGYEQLRELNPALVMVAMSGFGATGPYRSIPSHGVGFDAWAGVFRPDTDDEGRPRIPEHVSIGMNAGPLYGAIGVLAGVVRARATGEGCLLDVAQADAAVAFDWLRVESVRAYHRPDAEVEGNAADGGARRAPGTAGLAEGVRYQVYESADGHVLLMASERRFWRNFCEGVGRLDLFERWPGAEYADHAVGELELRDEIAKLMLERTSAEWARFATDHDTALIPVNDQESLAADPHFHERLPWLPAATHGADLVPVPVRLAGEAPPDPGPAPGPGQHTDDVLSALGYGPDEIQALRTRGALR